MKQLPESFCIAREGRTPETCPRWKRFIDWCFILETDTTGYRFFFYGYLNNKEYCSNAPFGQLLTLDQFEEIIGWKETEEFTLPEQWCILTTEENIEDVRKWFFENKHKYPACRKSWTVNEGGYYYAPGVLESGGWATDDELRLSDYGAVVELTYDQFKKYVMKKEPEQWQPKQGEMVQVSTDGHNWYPAEYIAYAEKSITGEKHVVYDEIDYGSIDAYEFCRPVPKVTTYSRSEAIKLLSQHTGKPESEIEIEK